MVTWLLNSLVLVISLVGILWGYDKLRKHDGIHSSSKAALAASFKRPGQSRYAPVTSTSRGASFGKSTSGIL